jgi:hypothetical protein
MLVTGVSPLDLDDSEDQRERRDRAGLSGLDQAHTFKEKSTRFSNILVRHRTVIVICSDVTKDDTFQPMWCLAIV